MARYTNADIKILKFSAIRSDLSREPSPESFLPDRRASHFLEEYSLLDEHRPPICLYPDDLHIEYVF